MGMMRGEREGHLGDTVPKWEAAVNGAPGALQSRDLGLPAGRRSPASIQINSRRSLAQQGSGERRAPFQKKRGSLFLGGGAPHTGMFGALRIGRSEHTVRPFQRVKIDFEHFALRDAVFVCELRGGVPVPALIIFSDLQQIRAFPLALQQR